MKPTSFDDLNQLFELSIDMLSIVRANGTFKHVNPAWTATLGWSKEELVNSPYMHFVHPDDYAATAGEAARLAQGASTIDFENRYRAKDGTYRWMNWRVTPSTDGQLYYCLTRDVTDDRRLRDALAERAGQLQAANTALDLARSDIQAVLDHSPVVVFVTDTEGRYRMLNSASVSITGRPPRDLIGRSAADVFPPETAEQLAVNLRRVIAEGRALTFEETLPVGDGYRVYSVIRFPLRDAHGDISSVCGMSLDITDQRAAAEAIQQARHEADRANRAKSDFLSRMSHELRTPLNAMLGFAQLFDRDAMTPDERENVRHILEGGRHLLDLINEVIDISRVESGTLALSNEAVDVDDAVTRAVGIIRPLAAQRGIDIRVLGSLPGLAVFADRQRLRQVLLNLLSNAVKYNHPDGSITVRCTAVDGRVHISVLDTGPGIRPEQLPLLFHPFERLGAENTAVEGTGLGLALSKALCEAMAGHLHVHSVVDQGTTFTIDLLKTEAATISEAVPDAGHVEADAAVAGTVVYIEDNSANARLMERIIARRAGLRLLHVGDGRSGVDLVRRRRPAIVLLDLQLPGMSGEAVLHELRSTPETRGVPVVILTADATRGLPERLMRAGARACLTKPLDVNQVLQTIDQLISERVVTP